MNRQSFKQFLSRFFLGRKVLDWRYEYYYWKRWHKKIFLLRRLAPEISRHINEVVRGSGVVGFADYGTLLGIVRERGLVAHDIDMDYSLVCDSKKMYEILVNLLDQGYTFRKAFVYEGELTEFSVGWKGVGVDFFRYIVSGDVMYTQLYYPDHSVSGNHSRWPGFKSFAPIVDEVTTCKGTRFEQIVPKNYEDVLKAHYGNWRVKNSRWNYASEGRKQAEALSSFGELTTLRDVIRLYHE